VNPKIDTIERSQDSTPENLKLRCQSF